MTLLLTMLFGTAASTFLSVVPGVVATIINTSIGGIVKMLVLLGIFTCMDMLLIPVFPVLPCVVCIECVILLYALLLAIGVQVTSTATNMIVYTIVGVVTGVAGSYLLSVFAGGFDPLSLSAIPIMTLIPTIAGGLIGIPVGAVVTTIINLPTLIVSPLNGILGMVLWPVSGAVVGSLSGIGCGLVGAISLLISERESFLDPQQMW